MFKGWQTAEPRHYVWLYPSRPTRKSMFVVSTAIQRVFGVWPDPGLQQPHSLAGEATFGLIEIHRIAQLPLNCKP